MRTVEVLVDGGPVQIESPPLGVILHQGTMNVEVPTHVLVGPEKTVEASRNLESDQWALIRDHANFLKFWSALYPEAQPPLDLQKSSLAVKHSVGMILLLVQARAEHKPVHLQYPETYLHPQQQARVVMMLMELGYGDKDA